MTTILLFIKLFPLHANTSHIKTSRLLRSALLWFLFIFLLLIFNLEQKPRHVTVYYDETGGYTFQAEQCSQSVATTELQGTHMSWVLFLLKGVSTIHFVSTVTWHFFPRFYCITISFISNRLISTFTINVDKMTAILNPLIKILVTA